ncbi:hypothetical protein E3N88_28806 [Mikania micrantha]|uniref:Uncharacterized protein n=1 Tax=Mikania micrantha TaxID=192012 RepID=A0A5N6N3B5_9ASTR|nr:hypothetical protein E3N88_28806 [Mikania micrantha]
MGGGRILCDGGGGVNKEITARRQGLQVDLERFSASNLFRRFNGRFNPLKMRSCDWSGSCAMAVGAVALVDGGSSGRWEEAGSCAMAGASIER